MIRLAVSRVGLIALLGSLAALAKPPPAAHPPVTLLYQNHLNWTEDVQHPSFLLVHQRLGSQSADDTCAFFSEKPVDVDSAHNAAQDLVPLLRYANLAGDLQGKQKIRLSNASVVVDDQGQSLAVVEEQDDPQLEGPVLCTQSDTYTTSNQSYARLENLVYAYNEATNNTFVGYRNLKSFRFSGIHYTNNPARFVHSDVSKTRDSVINAKHVGPICYQYDPSMQSEDCLFANVFTPFLPGYGFHTEDVKPTKLRPVLFYLHAGSYLKGSGSDPVWNGANLASRGDVVVVTINYRLNVLGFLNVPGTNITGNYGLSDIINGLEWVKQNIQYFGGDPNRITVGGYSAGASAVRILLDTPAAAGKFVGAIISASPGGYPGYGSYSDYPTPEEAYERYGKHLIAGVGCNSTQGKDGSAHLDGVVKCLHEMDPFDFVYQNQSIVPHYPIVDGLYISAPFLDVLNAADTNITHVPVLYGHTADDAAPFVKLVADDDTREEAITSALTQTGNSSEETTILAQEDLFAVSQVSANASINAFYLTAQIATDTYMRCINQATIYSGLRHGIFPKVYAYEFQRAYAFPGSTGNDGVCDAPVTEAMPNGDTSQPYLRCHGGDVLYIFGTFGELHLPLRDAIDVNFTMTTMDHWAAFVRYQDPNPTEEYLVARGYETTLNAFRQNGPWTAVERGNEDGGSEAVRLLDYPQEGKSTFVRTKQCAVEGLPIDMFEKGK